MQDDGGKDKGHLKREECFENFVQLLVGRNADSIQLDDPQTVVSN
jgi:hypothetical protein